MYICVDDDNGERCEAWSRWYSTFLNTVLLLSKFSYAGGIGEAEGVTS